MAATEQAPDPVVFTSTTPAGIEVLYSPEPRRYYAVREVAGDKLDALTGEPANDWEEVPSVTSILDCLKTPLQWWGMRVGVRGVLELWKRNVIRINDQDEIADNFNGAVDDNDIVKFLTEQKLTVNHVLSDAGDRGTSVHDAFETWCKTGVLPHPEIYPESEAGYITGLRAFIHDFDAGGVAHPKTEVMVGSVEHKFAGRYDLECYFNGGKLVTRAYPKRPPKVEEVPAGRWLLDVKTSKGVYDKHKLQLAGYEGARIECGYTPTDYRAVIHITADGRYEFVQTHATFEDFLAVRRVYDVMKGLK